MTLVGTEFNVHGGSGHFQHIFFPDDKVLIGDSLAKVGTRGVSIGNRAGDLQSGSDGYNVYIGGGAGRNHRGSRNVAIGNNASANFVVNAGQDKNDSVFIGSTAGWGCSGDYNLGIGLGLSFAYGNNNLDILTHNQYTTPFNNQTVNNKLHIQGVIMGDTDDLLTGGKKIAIGDVSSNAYFNPEATLQVVPKGTARPLFTS